ncbi:1-acyl-sn-glycerol-3-phosphate acyltransferase [Anabaena cylindrica FACHB-243]|uniref:Phospholipid/glycerol acyltransferase n=1 Tax=Anabaena cylindrica (strain ATCC 27899 / PCC 7122) TaxID=272123 RepID=K9ZHS7_ANACC|nr:MULTISPECIES: 1-acyl-sn-glycerol-3-phosphate acyltransferase [Anabaena]AFZ57905.1 phospholipid/glycerol acyltransferase [Anabaena cylindrica PCC 7122]MBD2419739.1 1-acyl-sn-glycerol-3-phosphate acyltransferase [Anabaena cylindrica FACHB-243]MBY5281557.1 1-acyl-sn-glycerol-3-phosphate acyltransferase [Anabaena sp. CCAP 1446/1C]MBY5307190.1 1-acyl-sn-glycerol-3-phosphate acyltransferase [Anabaena sp. CCAP 1446/1C]MCM2405553.1 1-acyl-sn-glycerol-3-phosphate acyltransferase [Anabaena sp. CCAP 1
MELHSASTNSQSQLTNQPVNPQVASSTSRISPWLTPLAYFLGRNFVLPLFFGNINITGQENIPANSPVIFAPTHRSRWDSILLPYAVGRSVTGRDLRFMVTSSECQGMQGWFVRRMGGFPVDTQRPAIATLRHAVELMAHREMLVIYPEGGIYRDGKVHTLKPGIARLALTAESNHPGLEVKILPVGINYSQPYPNWGTDVNIHIGEAIKVADYINGCSKRNAKRLTADLANKLQQFSHQESEITSHAFAEMTNS